MLTQSKETRDAWRASQRTLDIKVTIDGKTYGATDINSLKYDSGAYNGDTFAIGSTYSNTVQIEFSHLIEGLKLGMEVRPSIGIKTSSGYVYEPLGVFIISSEIKMDRNNNLTTVSASDRFCGLEGAYTSKLTYPAKVLDVIAEICTQSGVKANTDDLARLPHQADLPAPITGQSYRKALGWIAQLYAGYALFDRQGLFTIRTISEPNYELDPSQYEQAGLTKNEAAYKINGIQCQVTITTKTRDGESTEETKTYQAGDATGSQIKLENNIMTPQRLNDIWEQLKDLTFYPFSLNWFGNPAVEAGDWLRLEDKQGNSFVVPNSSYTLDFNGGLSATSKADQTTSSDQMVPWQGNVAQTIKELKIRRSPDGTVVFPPSVTEPPANAKFNDVWFKKNGNSTELWIFEKQDDGSGKWIRKDLSDDEIKKKVADAQQELNQAKADIISNKQKADADIENLNKSIEDNKKVADESLQKLNDSVTNLQGQYDNNVVPNLNKVMADASDALQKYISAQNSIADLTKQAQEQGKDIADVTNTVKGLNINYANLAGDVSSTKVDVKGLQTTIGTANGDIAQLKLDAQNLQTMLAGKVD
ncbi:peptidase, partial [Limosilactobacillus reuteri]